MTSPKSAAERILELGTQIQKDASIGFVPHNIHSKLNNMVGLGYKVAERYLEAIALLKDASIILDTIYIKDGLLQININKLSAIEKFLAEHEGNDAKS